MIILDSPSASRAATLASIFSKAASALLVSTPTIISDTRFCVFALAALALSVSFFDLASAIFPSSCRMFPSRLLIAFSCASNWISNPFDTSSKLFLRMSAWRARLSSPLRMASSARLYQSSDVALAVLYFDSSCLWLASTRAFAWRIFDRSDCMSTTAWSSSFSGSSNASTIAFVYPLMTRPTRLKKFSPFATTDLPERGSRAGQMGRTVGFLATMLRRWAGERDCRIVAECAPGCRRVDKAITVSTSMC
mmetsp:Transcript_22058/g.54000  ORF Transcript_22058/g.54000 Transcript_22058/m.54000 type:complete len:250 (+) Transcript_22058:574-1323(+)